MIKFTKDTLTELAGLGSGAVGAAYVQQKVLIKRDETGAPVVNADGETETLFGAGRTADLLVDVAPTAVGLVLQGQKNKFIKEAGKGMIASSIGTLIKKNVLPEAGIAGMDPMIGEMEASSNAGDFSTNEPLINGTGYDYSERETDF